MTALPCPACGYLGLLRFQQFDFDTGKPTNVWAHCPRCDGVYTLTPLSPDGVGPERLVPVEVGA